VGEQKMMSNVGIEMYMGLKVVARLFQLPAVGKQKLMSVVASEVYKGLKEVALLHLPAAGNQKMTSIVVRRHLMMAPHAVVRRNWQHQ
jgi:hypothetical protein